MSQISQTKESLELLSKYQMMRIMMDGQSTKIVLGILLIMKNAIFELEKWSL